MKYLILTGMLLAFGASADEICVNWQTNDPQAQSTVLRYTREKFTSTETCIKTVTSTPKAGSRYCYTFTTPAVYTFRVAALSMSGEMSDWSNEMTAVVE